MKVEHLYLFLLTITLVCGCGKVKSTSQILGTGSRESVGSSAPTKSAREPAQHLTREQGQEKLNHLRGGMPYDDVVNLFGQEPQETKKGSLAGETIAVWNLQDGSKIVVTILKGKLTGSQGYFKNQ